MDGTKNAKVTLDLTPLGKDVVECDATIEFNVMGQPETIAVIIGGLKAAHLNRLLGGTLSVADVFGKVSFSGTVEGGSSVGGVLTFIKSVDIGFAEATLECYFDSATVTSASAAVGAPTRWVFGLANYRIAIGDISTELPPPELDPQKIAKIKASLQAYHETIEGIVKTTEQIDAEYKSFKSLHGEKRLNRIDFAFAGRKWTLTDDYFGRWPKEPSRLAEPMRSGSLSTDCQEGDSAGSLQQIADDISDLLSLALGRDIKWVQCESQLEDGASQSIQFRKPGLLAFNQNRSCLSDNWETGNLRKFLEGGEKVLVADRGWWSATIALLTQVGATKYAVVKCSLLNTLLDRITSNVFVDSNDPLIDPKLNERIDARWFRWVLHRILRLLSSNWERYRTEALCDNVIKGWNAEPSFPEKVIRSCESLGIKSPARSKIGVRHKLLHAGEFDKKLKTMDAKIEYLFGIEGTVLMLLVRMLGFNGLVYLQSSGPDPKKVSEFLTET